MGGIYDDKVTKRTDVLIRGKSPLWKYGEHGHKEERLAELIAYGSPAVMVYDSTFAKLMNGQSRVRTAEYVAGYEVAELRAEGIVTATTADIGLVGDREVMSKARLEQYRLRRSLLNGKDAGTCSFCGIHLPKNLLIAAHIKPRGECSTKEMADPMVVALACQLGCDALYEKGYITVTARGAIRVTRSGLPPSVRNIYAGRGCARHSESTAKYFAWHAEYRFKR